MLHPVFYCSDGISAYVGSTLKLQDRCKGGWVFTANDIATFVILAAVAFARSFKL